MPYDGRLDLIQPAVLKNPKAYDYSWLLHTTFLGLRNWEEHVKRWGFVGCRALWPVHPRRWAWKGNQASHFPPKDLPKGDQNHQSSQANTLPRTVADSSFADVSHRSAILHRKSTHNFLYYSINEYFLDLEILWIIWNSSAAKNMLPTRLPFQCSLSNAVVSLPTFIGFWANFTMDAKKKHCEMKILEWNHVLRTCSSDQLISQFLHRGVIGSSSNAGRMPPKPCLHLLLNLLLPKAKKVWTDLHVHRSLQHH